MNTETTMQDRMAALRQKASQNKCNVWQPSPGDTLVGACITYKNVHVPKHGSQPQLLLKDEKGDVYEIWITQQIMQSLYDQKLDTGGLVAITFFGKKKTATGATYNAYEVTIEKTG